MSLAKRAIERQQALRIEANARRGPRGSFKGEDTFRYDIFGDKQLDQMFLSMGWTYQRAVIIKAFRKSAKPMVVAMKTAVRTMIKHRDKSTGNLEQSIGVYAPRQRMELDVGPRRFFPWKGHHGHLLEAGTVERSYTTAGGMFSKGVEHETGKMWPRFWFAKSIQQTKNEVYGRFRDDRFKAFHDHVTKFNKKQKT